MNYELLTAYLLDLVFGDPQFSWHPVRLIGRLIQALEIKLYTDKGNKKFCGAILVILVVGVTVFCVWLVLKLASFIHPVFYFIVSILFIYFSLSIKALGIEANKVYKGLESKNIQKARDNLSVIVGRDTKDLNEQEIIRATVETIAESSMDGIIAPLFYAFLGGPVLAWAYKAINTLDSMVGYRNERFIKFGWASAKLDGLLNFIPARLTCFLISVSGFCYRKYWFNSFEWTLKYLFRGPYFNSEATEAVMAVTLGIQLGGVNFYNSIPIKKPFIGNNLYPLETRHIKEAIKISYLCSLFGLIVAFTFKMWKL